MFYYIISLFRKFMGLFIGPVISDVTELTKDTRVVGNDLSKLVIDVTHIVIDVTKVAKDIHAIEELDAIEELN